MVKKLASSVLLFLLAVIVVVGYSHSASSDQAIAASELTPQLVSLSMISQAAQGQGTSTPQAIVDDYARVKEAGKIRVGTALDNPPFTFSNDLFQADGFDIAVMAEVSRRLGVKPEFNDFAFEGLLGAVQLEQVDAAIAALTITPERQKTVDFTNLYYVGQDGVLARADSPITSISSPAEIATRRVAVQRGSVYESFLRNTLVETGLMPPENLLSYSKPEHAARDVREQRADLAIFDLPVAQAFAAKGNLKLVGTGVYPQAYGIAVHQGSTLLPLLNQALMGMQADGTMAKLMEKYLHISAPSVVTAVPSPTAIPAACIHGMAYVADLNLDDKTMTAPPVMQPGQQFTKKWRIKNSGTCDWKSDFSFAYGKGNVPEARMQAQNINIGKTVAPGQTLDVSIPMVAPTQPGTYQGFWGMVTAAGQPFGELVWVGIKVPAPQPPKPTPQPGIVFTVDRQNIKAGECVTFRWNVTGVKAVYFYPVGQPYQNYGVAGQGEKTECPATATVYELRVEKADGSVVTQQIQINVEGQTGGPSIAQFGSNPQSSVQAGQCIDFWWEVRGAVDRVALVRGTQPLWDYAPVNGSYRDCPGTPGYTVYELQAWGPGGFVKADRGIDVQGSPPPQVPVIDSFKANPNQIPYGDCTELSWKTSGAPPDQNRIIRNGIEIMRTGGESRQYVDCPDEGGTMHYSLIVRKGSTEVFEETQVQVLKKQPK